MVSPKIKKHLPLLQYMAKGKPKIVKAIVNECDAEIMNVLCECAHNTLRGNVNLSDAQIKRLKRHRKELEILANKKSSIKRKKNVLQRGGFLPVLLASILPALSGVIGNIIGK